MNKYINDNIFLYNNDCNVVLENMIKHKKYIDLCITSPPYYNAREYSQYDNFENYMDKMKEIFKKYIK